MNVLVVGVHIDDCEFGVGGTTALLTKLGHAIAITSVPEQGTRVTITFVTAQNPL